MKKKLAILSLIIVLFNFIFVNCSYASNKNADAYSFGTSQGGVDNSETGDATEWLNRERSSSDKEDIKTDNGKITKSVKSSNTALAYVSEVIAKLILIPATAVNVIGSLFLHNAGSVVEHKVPGSSNFFFFSIQKIVCGEYFVLDTNIFLNQNVSDGPLKDSINSIRNEVKKWFFITRDISLALNLAIFVIIAIKLAISTVAAKRAQYKQALFGWVICLVLLFIFPYVLAAANTVFETIWSIPRDLMIQMENNGSHSFENDLLGMTFTSFTNAAGLGLFMHVILYLVLLWIELKFFILYMKRMLTVLFLIVIAPIISITYPLDKMNGKRSQALHKWSHEYIYNMSLPIIHCFIYMIFMFMADNIATKVPLLGMAFLFSMTKAERIIVALFGLSSNAIKDVNSQLSLKSATKMFKK